jgi:hypothetical protein
MGANSSASAGASGWVPPKSKLAESAVATVAGRPLAAAGGVDGVVRLWDLTNGTKMPAVTG